MYAIGNGERKSVWSPIKMPEFGKSIRNLVKAFGNKSPHRVTRTFVTQRPSGMRAFQRPQCAKSAPLIARNISKGEKNHGN